MSFWQNYEEDFIIMYSYIKNVKKILEKKSKKYDSVFVEYDKETTIQFIFESNTIEKEGLNEGETKKLYYEVISGKINENNLLKNISCICSKENISFEYNKKTKDLQTTYNQIIGLIIANSTIRELFIDSIKTEQLYLSRQKKGFRNKTNLNKITKPKSYITEDFIKNIHQHLTQELDNNNNGNPGEYRTDGACIGLDTIFTPPALINNSMRILIKNHEKRVNNPYYNHMLEGIILAAQLVRIHPFGDSNGRLSRIILNTFFKIEHLPFCLVLRAQKKDREKYIYCMKKYYSLQNISPFVWLVSNIFQIQIERLNSLLTDVGLPKITPAKLNAQEIEFIKNSLKYYITTR
ncbi:Fic family protein [Cetobacterium somerae]|uniref:Fic family protein n=1 Tax=Cetobacterium somerae TaxID=188913 RepID=UPI002257EF9A|nr:Fic family protein [Cetobacterium somerae]MCX3065973.1 Fic family protein [Cetobacterium somerae]